MARVAGSVTVADDESATGSGLSKAIYDAIVAEEAASLVSLTPPPTWLDTPAAWEQQVRPIRLRTRRAWARTAEAIAAGTLTYEGAEPPTGGDVTELVVAGDTRLVLATDALVLLQTWQASAWQTRGTFDLTGGLFVIDGVTQIRGTAPKLTAVGEYGVDIDTAGEQAVEPPDGNACRLSYGSKTLFVTDSTGRTDAATRTRPVVVNSGTATLDFDITSVVGGTATISSLPPATANDIGRIVGLANRKTSSLTVNRSGSDLIDGATSFVVPAGGRVLFECVAAGDWLVWGG